MGTSCPKNQIKRDSRLFDQPKTLTTEQILVILNQQSKSLCQIKTTEEITTGFLCNIPNPVLITNSQVVNEVQIQPGNQINICFTDKNKKKYYKTIIIDDKRTVYTIGKLNGEEIDTTIIELRPNEDGLNNQEFMEIDDQLMSDNVEDKYEKNDIYIIHYKDRKDTSLSIGTINEMKKENKSYTISHTCYTDLGSSGSPIILYNHKIIGIHRGYYKDKNINVATLLQYPIKEFLKKIYQKNLENENKNIINEDKIINFKNDIKKSRIEMKISDNQIDKTILNLHESNIVGKDEDNKITIIYIIDKKENGIRIFGKNFVENNKKNIKMIINRIEYDINDYIKYDKYGINKKDELLVVTLIRINKIIDASFMFSSCISLLSLPDIYKWDTKNVKSMKSMFDICWSLQSLSDISKWDTKNVMDMFGMFWECRSLKSLPDISKWDTKNVMDMFGMFGGCRSLESLPDISKWNTKNVTDMGCMFYECYSLKSLPDISKWDTKNVTDMNGMFIDCVLLHNVPNMLKKNY